MLFILVAVIIVGAAFAYSGLVGAIWLPARQKDIEELMRLSVLPKGGEFLDLGSGTASVLLAASQHQRHCAGVEINPWLVILSKLRTASKKNINIRQGSLWNADLGNADIIYTFLIPRFMLKFEQKIVSEAKPGSYVVSYAFSLPNLTPKLHVNNCYIYQIDKKGNQETSR